MSNRILLAAGVFFPDVGGPAIHVRKIADRLSADGMDVTVLAYGDDPSGTEFPFRVVRISREQHKALQWAKYSLLCFRLAAGSDLVYAFDPTAAGLMPRIASALFRKPFLIRVGGDPIWERQAETGKVFMPMSAYYDKGLHMKDKPLLFRLIKFTISGARRVVLYNEQFREFYSKHYSIDASKIRVVKNPVFRRGEASRKLPADPAVLFAGRFVKYKNLELVMRALANVRSRIGKGRLVLIGKGPERDALGTRAAGLGISDAVTFIDSLPQDKLFEEIKASALSIGPALSEFNPNFILESLSFGKPVLLSRGHGLSVELPEEFLFDPMDQGELESKLEALLDPAAYEKAVRTIASIEMNQTWESVTDFHSELVREMLERR